MAEAYITSSSLLDMGHDARTTRVEELYTNFKHDMINRAQNGEIYMIFEIAGRDWSFVNYLYHKIRNEHPGLIIKNDRSYIPGYTSEIVVKWDL